MAFRASQRGKPQHRQLRLQVAQIVPPQNQIMREVARTPAMTLMQGTRTLQ